MSCYLYGKDVLLEFIYFGGSVFEEFNFSWKTKFEPFSPIESWKSRRAAQLSYLIHIQLEGSHGGSLKCTCSMVHSTPKMWVFSYPVCFFGFRAPLNSPYRKEIQSPDLM